MTPFTTFVVGFLAGAVLGGITGALVFRNNARQAETALTAAQEELAKLKAAGQAVGSAIKSA